MKTGSQTLLYLCMFPLPTNISLLMDSYFFFCPCLLSRQEASGGRGWLRGGGALAFGKVHGQRRGRGQGKGQGEKISMEELDAELEKYHLDAMQIK